MKKVLFSITAMIFFAISASAFAEVSIGVIDLNKILTESPQVEKAKTDLKKKFDKQEKDLAAAQKKFQSAIEDFSKNSPTMKADAQKAEQQKIMEQQKKLQEMQTKFQKDVNAAQEKVLGDVLKKIESIVNKLATDKKLDLIVAKASLAYNKKELEVTDEVIKMLKK
ncbi:MAG: OmpH family outer membrane protein [Gammaproteobacteria bacterium]|nr:OmpH family outer membrane protein [Gammaproteobacteria bacterium]